jgi:hypothetical protein
MSKKPFSEPFSEKKQKQYERSARLQYGPETVNESIKRWNSYSKAEQERIMQESGQVYEEIAAAIDAGLAPESDDVQALLIRWEESIRYFYEPTLDTLRGLGDLYNTNPDFMANFQKIHADLPAYLQAAITHYVDDLEDVELARLIAEDDEDHAADGR